MKQKVVIIGANEFQNPIILKAKQCGYETHVFAWEDGSPGESSADFFYPVSITKMDMILDMCRELHPAAVVSIGSDLASVTVNYIAEQLGLTGNSTESTKKATDKYEMRKTLAAGGISVPQFVKIVKKPDSDLDIDKIMQEISGFHYPIIVKPTDRSGSRGITKLESGEGLFQAVEEAIGHSFKQSAIIEEFLDGEEYSCESISYEGKHSILAFTKKYTTGSPHFIETGHMEPTGLSDEQEKKIKNQIVLALDALNIKYGAAHSEFKMDTAGNIRIIEIGARMGGDCIGSHLIPISTGYDYVKMVLDVSLGIPPVFEKVREPKVAAIKFVLGRTDQEKIKNIQNNNLEYVEEITDIDIKEYTAVTDSSSRFGYGIFAFDTMEEARRLLD